VIGLPVRIFVVVAVGACGGSHQPAPLSNADTPTFEVVVADAMGANHLVVDDRFVYWIGNSKIWRADKRVHATAELLSESEKTGDLAVAADKRVFWVTSGTIFYLNAEGLGPFAASVNLGVWSLALRGTEPFVASFRAGNDESVILQLDTASNPLNNNDRVIARLAGGEPLLHADRSGLYVATTKVFVRIDASETAVPLSMTAGVVTAIATDGDVFVAANQTIQRLAPDGTRLTKLADASGEIGAIAIDDRFVYWSEVVPDDSVIYRVSRRGGVRQVVAHVGDVRAIVVEGPFVYWSDSRMNQIARKRR
jgi:hypothetical protein